VSSSKRERELARRRHEKWQQRQIANAKKHRRNVVIGSVATAVVVVALIVFLATRPTAPVDPVADPAATATDSLQEPETTDAASQPAEDGATAPDPALAEGRDWTGSISLNGSPVDITLDGAAAPQAVANFVTLAQEGYFDGTSCHRLTTAGAGIFVLQCGDPEGTGMGGPGYSWGPIENAPANDLYPTGTLAMARQGGNGESMGSQFFIVYDDSTISSDDAGGYTVFGTVTNGLDAVQQIADAGVEGGASDGTPATPAVIEGVEVQ